MKTIATITRSMIGTYFVRVEEGENFSYQLGTETTKPGFPSLVSAVRSASFADEVVFNFPMPSPRMVN